MSAFVLTMFWAYLFCAVVALCTLISTNSYPRKRSDVGVGFDAASCILHLAVMAWAAYLYWGKS